MGSEKVRRPGLVVLAFFIIMIMLVPFLPEYIAQTRRFDFHLVCIYILPPFLFIFCGLLWLYLSSRTEQDRNRLLIRAATVLSVLTVFWIFVSLTLSDSFDSLTVDLGWKDGAYFIWVGGSILAVDMTVMLWGTFRALRLIGGGPVPYVVAAVLVLFMTTPLSLLATNALGIDVGDLWTTTHVMVISMMVATAVSLALFWGMVSDRCADEKVRRVNVQTKMAIITVLLMVGTPSVFLFLWLFFGGYS